MKQTGYANEIHRHGYFFAIATMLLLATALMAAIGLLRRPLASAAARRDIDKLPTTMLWAWERPEQLKFIDGRQTGVAFLARSLYLRGDTVVVRPRLQPLEVPANAALLAVLRIESDPRLRPTLSPEQIGDTADAIAAMAGLSGVHGLQIDFDATRSERDFYKRVLIELRGKLRRSKSLSITALASWCIYDDWLAELPIDEAVPMLFRMGAGHREVLAYLERHERFRAPACRGSVGLSVDEPLANLPPHRRAYLFNPMSWTPESVRQAKEDLSR